MDVFSTAKRSDVMAKVRNKDTAPEMLVRRHLHAIGLRFRLHRKGLPGRPDIVFPGRKVVVFVHGCFWHGHGCKKAKLPTTRVEFWRDKIEGNMSRDERRLTELAALGWRALVVWECEIDGQRLDRLRDEIGP